jgi:hypothetical protein
MAKTNYQGHGVNALIKAMAKSRLSKPWCQRRIIKLNMANTRSRTSIRRTHHTGEPSLPSTYDWNDHLQIVQIEGDYKLE